ncbi:FkbM family methyltransferase [Massilia sp. METH4]|uniref:FkbM family methyltransferase n=1 Tax=Massilia sp. METH4 TaxID=3123041 RepID=UPI0030D507ED
MTFITYAQNGEDVLLWRALGHIQGGFYVDVGANDPVEHSVTRAFYDAGWSGINIEPLPSFHRRFEEQRPRDINLAIAAGSAEGELTLYDVPAVNGWASPDAGVAAAHRAEGFDVVEMTVPVRTLDAVWDEHVRGDVHFLKIDVEGFEAEVLRGFDLRRHRPWVLVVEATLPNSRVTNHEKWEPLVVENGYRFAWFDGLNRYYVAEEHAELLAALTVQPNVFDDYLSHHLVYEREQAAAARAAAAAAGEAHANAVAAWEAANAAHAHAVAALEAAQRDTRSKHADVLAAHERITELDRIARDGQAELAAAHARIAELDRTVQDGRAELAAAHGRITELDYMVQDGRAELAAARARITELDRMVQDGRGELSAAHARIAELDGLTRDGTTKLATARERIVQLDRALLDGEEKYATSQRQLGETSAYAELLERELAAANQRTREVQHRLDAVLASTSWKITEPLRAVNAGEFKQWVRWRTSAHVRDTVTRLVANEKLRRRVIPMLARFPTLNERVVDTVARLKRRPPEVPQEAREGTVEPNLRDLPVSARRAFADLSKRPRPPES